MKHHVIAIDGHSGSGKSSTAKHVASRLAFKYLDSGAMYRAVTYYVQKNDLDIESPHQLSAHLSRIKVDFVYNKQRAKYETLLNEVNIEDEIRRSKVTEDVSRVSAVAKIREAMVSQQRLLAQQASVVMDGRDIGTVVFPEADLKIFITASLQERARRRKLELDKLNDLQALDQIEANLQKRDEQDMNRKISPLRQADDAIVVDTTNLSFEQQVNKIVQLAIEQLKLSV